MVNLPDLIPSIRYNATNSYGAMYRCCGKAIPEVTGKAFYTAKTPNAKLGYEEYNMPVLYAMAKKIAAAQAAALSDGRTLVLYEGYRPLRVQRAGARTGSLRKVFPTTRKALPSTCLLPPWQTLPRLSLMGRLQNFLLNTRK